MRLSKYAHFVELENDEYLLVSLVTKTVIKLSSELKNLLSTVSVPNFLCKEYPELWDFLSEHLILVPDNLDEWDLIKQIHINQIDTRKTLSLVITPTLDCNMGCFYCFENHKKGDIPRNLDKQIIEIIKSKINEYEHIHVQWFGGEPLLAMPSIKRLTNQIINICKENNVHYSAEIITNGHLLTSSVAKELKELHIIDAQVTFEGNKYLHNKIRSPYKSADSYQTIINNSIAASSYVNISCRVHVTPYNIDSLNELLIDLAANKLDALFTKLYFAPLFDYKPYKNDVFFTTDDKKYLNSKIFAEYQVELTKKAMQLGFKIRDILDVTFDICMAVQKDSLVIGPDGLIHKCYLDSGNEKESVGHLQSGFNNQISKWNNYDFSTDEECKQCSFAPICLGGCPKQHMNNSDKSVVCTPLKYNFSEMIKLFDVYQ